MDDELFYICGNKFKSISSYKILSVFMAYSKCKTSLTIFVVFVLCFTAVHWCDKTIVMNLNIGMLAFYFL